MHWSSRHFRYACLLGNVLVGCANAGDGVSDPELDSRDAGKEAPEPIDGVQEAEQCEESKSAGRCYMDATEALFETTRCGGSELPAWWYARNECYAAAHDKHSEPEEIFCFARTTWAWAECASDAACDATKLDVCMSAQMARAQDCDVQFSEELTEALVDCIDQHEVPD